MKRQSDFLTLGSKIQYKNGQMKWVDSVITRTTSLFVWFNGSGYDRIKRSTFDNHPDLYRIISL